MELNRERERGGPDRRVWNSSQRIRAWSEQNIEIQRRHTRTNTVTLTQTQTRTRTQWERERERESFEIEKWKIKKREGVLSWWEFAGEREGDYRGERTGHGRILGEISGWPSTNFYYLLCLFGLWTPLPLLGLPSSAFLISLSLYFIPCFKHSFLPSFGFVCLL